MNGVRSLVAHLVTPLVWRIPGHAARKLTGFARAEEGSRIDMLQAARLTDSSERRALYLRHAVDEARHAGLFARRARELRLAAGQPPQGRPRADTEDLFERLGELRFLAFVHRGEARGRRQFEIYEGYFARRADRRTAGMFRAILADERRHERYTRELLLEVAGSEPDARRALRWAALWEGWRRWRRAGRALARILYAASMTVLYVLVVPLARVPLLLSRRTRPGHWLSSSGGN